ncbi:D-glyceryl-ACP synthase [Shewanella psychrophila]|uniref:D-glyceryl-ACP synthase n=1 Tax=Shewanella psychrophila TaxID=225848 RepID=A0A1S6HIW0_9GAMM|nr:HAD-IIIC family phosphatase [Shewanella psychrophila]AQS35438.1 D-glyceryl-ACP synthase [Shewanella psychrophila]
MISANENNEFAVNLAGVNICDRHQLMQTLRRTTDPTARVSAGRKCRKISQDWLNTQGFKPVNFAVTGSFSTAMVGELLTAGSLEKGLMPSLYLSDYNQFAPDVLDVNSDFIKAEADYSLCLLDEHIILERLPTPWSLADIQEACEQVLTLCQQGVRQLLEHTRGMAIFNTIPLPLSLQRQMLGSRERNQLSRLWLQFNLDMLAMTELSQRVLVLDMQCLMTGTSRWRDERLAFYAKLPYSDGLMDILIREVSALAASTLGHSKKALILDLDNTLWSGILGDDGVDGIGLDGNPAGEAHLLLQRVIKQFASQGVLLNISSKNDRENVDNVFEKRQDMVLKASDFLHIQANWSPKSQAVADIAESLNIGIDSFVFVDDSSFECEEVQSAHPSLASLQVTGEPAYFAAMLANMNDFLMMSVSAEDKDRPHKYRQETHRQALKASSQDLTSFLESLNIELSLTNAKAEDVPRIANLSQRTNQFNMTTQRLSEAAVIDYLENENKSIWVLRSHDRFGDYGLIGAVLISMTLDTSHIDNMLLSCRVFSRGIEQAAISLLLAQAVASGKTSVTAEFILSHKNQRMATFYPSMGFTTTALTHQPQSALATGTPKSQLFVHTLSEIAPLPGHLTTINEESCNA